MKKAKSTTLVLNGYAEFLGELKQRIASARLLLKNFFNVFNCVLSLTFLQSQTSTEQTM